MEVSQPLGLERNKTIVIRGECMEGEMGTIHMSMTTGAYESKH